MRAASNSQGSWTTHHFPGRERDAQQVTPRGGAGLRRFPRSAVTMTFFSRHCCRQARRVVWCCVGGGGAGVGGARTTERRAAAERQVGRALTDLAGRAEALIRLHAAAWASDVFRMLHTMCSSFVFWLRLRPLLGGTSIGRWTGRTTACQDALRRHGGGVVVDDEGSKWGPWLRRKRRR